MARAGQALGDRRARHWIHASARWASRYISTETGDDTFNLYDTSALAHADLVHAIRTAGVVKGLPLDEGNLLADLRAQLGIGVSRAAGDPFRSGVIYDGFDAAPHTFGLIVTAELYRRLTGSGTYEDFATQQRDWILGDNAWGASMMIGVGTTFPNCPQHVVANLSGTVDGTKPYLRGAVVNGPNSAGLFKGGLGGFFGNAPKCPADHVDRYAQFTARGSRFVDDVRSWQTVEPAIDFTGAAALAFALLR
jgi:endoglucanase